MAIGLVLGAGGVIGRSYTIGTLAALADSARWDARTAAVIVGTSAGAGTGATLRLGLSPADHRARLTGRPISPEGHRLVGDLSYVTEFDEPEPPRGLAGRRPQAPGLVRHGLRRPWPTGLGVGISGLLPRGTVPIGPLGDKLRLLYGSGWPDDPLWICALRMSDGRRVVFGRDPAPGSPACPPLARAVEASSAIPGYFEPVEVDGELYLDGAAHSSTNADLLADRGLDGVVVISPMSAVGEELRWHPRWASRAGYHKVLGLEVDRVEAAGTPVLVFEPTGADLELMTGDALDDSTEADLVERAHATATDRLHRLGISDLARSWGRTDGTRAERGQRASPGRPRTT
ncbi:MAG: patatin-like phospholipase family protein [Acidimicrobiales bacterium]|nr:patatin-like phospholipase family protein [Acidimicrobiales bacterium]